MSWQMFRTFMAKYGLTFNASYVLSLLKPIVSRSFWVRRTIGGITTDYPVPFVAGGIGVGAAGIGFSWKNDLGFDVLISSVMVTTNTPVDDNDPAVLLSVGIETDLVAPSDDSLISAFPIGAAGQSSNLPGDPYAGQLFVLCPADSYIVGWTPGAIEGWEGTWGAVVVPIPA